MFSPTFSWYYDAKIVKKVNGGAQLIIQGIDPQSLKREYYAADAESGRVLGTLGQYPLKEAAYSAGRNGQKGSYLLSYETAGGSGETAYSAVSVEGESFSTGRELLSGKSSYPSGQSGGIFERRSEGRGMRVFPVIPPTALFLLRLGFPEKYSFPAGGRRSGCRREHALRLCMKTKRAAGSSFGARANRNPL